MLALTALYPALLVSDALPAPGARLELAPLAVLVGAAGGGGGGYAHVPGGLFLGADSGVATILPSGKDSAHAAWTFGARGGYQWRSGVALQARFDDLGVEAPSGGPTLLTATAGLRYSLPFEPMPFGEVLVGPAIFGSQVTPTVAVGVGISLPVLRHLVFDLSVRDWVMDVDSAVRNVLTGELGVSVIFGR